MKMLKKLLMLLVALLPASLAAAPCSTYNYRAVSSVTPSDRIPRLYICALETDLPAVGSADGDIGYAKDTDLLYVLAAGVWTDITTGGGGAGTPTGTGYRHVTAGVEDAASVSPIPDADIPNNITIDFATQAGTGDTPVGFFSSLSFVGDYHLTIDNSDSGAGSEGSVHVESDVSALNLRALSGGHAAPGDYAVGDDIVEATSRLYLAGGSSIIFGKSSPSVEKMRLQDGLSVGTTTDPGAGIINVLTGYRIGNAAASGAILKGDGSNFVSSPGVYQTIQSGGVGVTQRDTLNFTGAITCSDFGGVTRCSSATYAPLTGPKYWTGASDANLTDEKDLSALGTGLVLNTAGVPTIKAANTCTNQFPRSDNTSGVWTCASVAAASDVTGVLPVANGGTGLSAMAVNLVTASALSTTTFTNLSGMSFTLAANTNYSYVCYMFNVANAATVGVQYQITFGGTTSFAHGYYQGPTTATTVTWLNDATLPITHSPLTSQGNIAGLTILTGTIFVSGTGGTLQFQHASETATLTTTQAGSWCHLTKY